MKAVIMAGGRGTRISPVAADVPKPMIEISGRPVLEHEIDRLREQGITDLIITVSHLGHVIMNYFGNGSGISPATGRPFGVNIQYFHEEKPLGNAGALFRLRENLTEDFLLLNADVLFDVDLGRFIDYHRAHGGLATLLTHPNSHPYDSGLLIAAPDGAVLRWLAKEDERPQWYKNRVNAGIHILSPQVLDRFFGRPGGSDDEKIDLDRQVLRPLCGTGLMFCYDSPEYVKDMGTPERLEAIRRDWELGRVRRKNLKHRQRAIFLDRDGTINRHVGFLKNIDDFALLPGAAEAIGKINASGYLAIVATNQPVLARGELTEEGLGKIHDKMETLLGQRGAYLDAIYYCPHHPHQGYEGERPELKINCGCRKPRPGMLVRASGDFNIDLGQSWMIGDGKNDVEAGRAAGCRTALIGDGEHGQAISAGSLLEAVGHILEID